MMKISKPVLTNDFNLSPVQFTSLNTIVFKNVKNVYDGNEKIVLEYEHSSKIESSSRDWIGIFPRGWSTLQQYVTFEWTSQSLPCGNNEQNKENGDLTRRTVYFCPKYHMGTVNSNLFYQFVYVSKQIEVLGVSNYFRFEISSVSDPCLELECLVPVSPKLRSTSVSDFGVLVGNKVSSTSLDTRTLQTTSIHSLQNLDTEGKNWGKPPLSLSDLKKPSAFSRKTVGTGDTLDPYSSHSEPIFPMTIPTNQCKKCFHFKRGGGELMRSQQVLQSKLKIVMERNKVLEERAIEMKKEMDRLQAESKKLKTSFYNVNKEKVAYEKFVKDFIKSLEKDSIVRVVNGNTEILVKKVNYVGMEEHPRDKKTSKRERELKAVIGLQEITIRNLINSLQEKAKSVQELNQTVKLAQAFSSARDESRDYGSDDEESSNDASNSDVTSEYEFSLTKPPPPDEVTVDDTDAVLDDIRRATEMELKDIGISRSLGKSSSRDSMAESGMPNLSVRSYQCQNEGTRPKKPRLFDNVEDCWPFREDSPKIIHKKVIEPEPKIEENEKEPEETETDMIVKAEETNENMESEPTEVRQDETVTEEVEVEQTVCENYYDACEALAIQSPTGGTTPREDPEQGQAMTVYQDKEAEEEEEKKANFLVTALIPHDMDMKPGKNVEEWLKGEKEGSEEKKVEVPEKGKKFTCQLSIDFAAKVLQNQKRGDEDKVSTNEEEGQSQCKDLLPADSQVRSDSALAQEKPLLTVKKANKCLEIKITQVEQKENTSKNVLHQKMVLKFEKDSQANVESKPSKFEFNLAVKGLGDAAAVLKTEDELTENKTELVEVKQPENDDASPRTVWNDASEELAETPRSEKSEELPKEKEEEEEEKEKETIVEEKKESEEKTMDLYQDSLRYEKNLEFLQQKTNDKAKAEEEVAAEKPTAILIQNGQTKLALIRY